MRTDPRRGTILLAVAGAAALLASLTTAFLVRMRADVEESAVVVREAQARIMLMAACGYVLESGRLGWDRDPHVAGRPHEEGHGWIDVRDGTRGPRDQDGAPLFADLPVESWRAGDPPDRPAWPAVGSVARCPMHVRARPPYAIGQTVVYNPIETDRAAAGFGLPYLTRPDPQPATANGWPDAIDASRYGDFVAGDPRPRPTSTGLSWFRVHRERDAVFVVTCGAGGTQGWRDWEEIPAGQRATFGDRQAFEDVAATEKRLWYRLEWSAAVSPSDSHLVENEAWMTGPDPSFLHPINVGECSAGRSPRSATRCPNLVGTIRWIERLARPPARW